MSKSNQEFSIFDGIQNASQYNSIPPQTLPDKQKDKHWRKAVVDSLEQIGIQQLDRNLLFREWKAMAEGRFTHLGTGISNFQELPWFDKEVRKLRADRNIDTYVKHFDFIGIITRAVSGAYAKLDDRYRVESIDEYSTNEYIRQKTELLHKYAKDVFKQEIDKLLLIRGFNPSMEKFESEEEQQAYEQEKANQIKQLTPSEIEESLSKNFKVIATEWAQNVLKSDKKRFYLSEKDKEDFINYLITGRYFRHYRVGYDNYYIETWQPEETFFSQDYDIKYPQDSEFAGRIFDISVNNILNRYGHLMTTKQQESIGNYWNQDTKNFKKYNSSHFSTGREISPEEMIFPKPTQVPFHNYFDHSISTQLEDALNIPLGKKTIIDDDGNEESFSTWTPRLDSTDSNYTSNISEYLRDDIAVRKDTVRVVEGYWVSQKRMGVLITEQDLGGISIDLVTDDLLKEYLKKEEIKKLKETSLYDLQKALKNDNLEDFVNTITYIFIPEVWQFVKIRGNGSTIKEDMYLGLKPLDYQIKSGDSEIGDVKLPLSGIITNSVIQKTLPYQQLHNISMNQITELLEKELGVFFSFDLGALGEEYQDETTEEALYRTRENIKDTGLLGLDLSRGNTQGNNPNVFQRQEVVYATQVQYRWQLAQQYKQEAFNQIGVTPQMLGQPSTYVTAEGVKQGAQASFNIIDPYFDEMNVSKAKGMEVQLAIAQFCEKEGKSAHLLSRKGDSELRFLDILKEDPDIFPLRKISVHPETGSSERKTVEQIKQFILNDNTIDRSMNDVIEILTNPVLVEIQQKAKEMEAKSSQKLNESRQFESQENDKKIQAEFKQGELKHSREVAIENIKGEYRLKEEQIASLGKAADRESNQSGIDEINKATKLALESNKAYKEYEFKNRVQDDKMESDKEYRRIEMQKLAQKSEELRLRDKQISVTQQGNIINKN